jgi:hypothetical protein
MASMQMIDCAPSLLLVCHVMPSADACKKFNVFCAVAAAYGMVLMQHHVHGCDPSSYHASQQHLYTHYHQADMHTCCGCHHLHTAHTGCGVAQMALGDSFTCVILKPDGMVKCWGYPCTWINPNLPTPSNKYCDRTGVAAPITVPLPKAAKDISASSGAVCAIVEGGAVYCW